MVELVGENGVNADMGSCTHVYGRYNRPMSELAAIDHACTRCGLCAREQAREGMPESLLGDLAGELLEAEKLEDLSPETYEFVRSCLLCNACTQSCPEGISCAQTVRAARERLSILEPELIDEYRAFRVDYQENWYSLLRKAAGFTYEDALDGYDGSVINTVRDAADARDVEHLELPERCLFFAGCSLSSYSRELTQATYQLLHKQGLVQGLSVHCCGKPLDDMGQKDACGRYGKQLVSALKQARINKLVVACPNCFYALRALLKQEDMSSLVLEPLPLALERLGMRYEGSCQSVTVHDSCPDRKFLLFAQSTRALFASSAHAPQLIEMTHHAEETLCCGSGGLASVFNPNLGALRLERRLAEYSDSGGERLVCSCINCTQRFSSDSSKPAVSHYLELLLHHSIDWQQVQEAVDQLYLESLDQLSLPLTQCTPVFSNMQSEALGRHVSDE